MLLSFAPRGWSCWALASALLIMAVAPAAIGMTARPTASPADWMRDYTPAQFRQLPTAKAAIDSADFCEPLLAAAIFQETNRQRAALQLPAFLPDEKASNAARQHAEWMARTHLLTHDEPSARGAPITALDRLARQGLQAHATAENIAYNLLPDLVAGRLFYTRLEDGRPLYSYQPGGLALRAHTYNHFAQVILAQWMHSPQHRAHIASPEYRFLGVGVALAHRRGHPDTIYATQDFFTPRAPASTPVDVHAEATLLPSRS